MGEWNRAGPAGDEEVFTKILISVFSFLGQVMSVRSYSFRFFFGAGLGVLWFDIIRLRRRIILDNLEIAFPDKSDAERVRLGRQVMKNFCTHLFELFMIPHITHEWMEKNVIFHDEENYRNALAKGKGVLVLSLHLGHGDLAASLIQFRGYPLTIITKFFTNQTLNKIWFYFRGATGVQFIAPHGEKTPFDILKSLKAQRGVVFVVDQYMGPPFGIETKFFGRATGTAFGLGLFMNKTGAPVVPTYAVPGEDGKIHIYFEREMELSTLITGRKKEDLVFLTQAFNDKIESIVRQYPQHWMWIHRRWKEFG